MSTPNKIDKGMLIELAEAGYSGITIANKLGVTYQAVYNFAVANKINIGLKVRAELILRCYRVGMTASQIASAFSINVISVYRIINKYKEPVSNYRHTKLGIVEFLDREVVTWLVNETPDGVSFDEYAAAIIRDAYNDYLEVSVVTNSKLKTEKKDD